MSNDETSDATTDGALDDETSDATTDGARFDEVVAERSDLVEAPLESVDPDTTQFSVMSVESVLFDLSDSSPLVHLTEAETPYRYLAIPIALPEAVALHNALDKIDGRRPGTHEVMSRVLARLQADIIASRITRYENGVFYAELDIMTPKGHEVFDCRTSDALILAVRQGVTTPVLCAESVLQAFYA